MSTAQIIYEQYKVLPKRVRQELKSFIVNEQEPSALLNDIKTGLQEVNAIQAGKLPKRTFADLKREMGNAE